MRDMDLRRLDLNLLVTFDVLMAERNVTRAAERLDVREGKNGVAFRTFS